MNIVVLVKQVPDSEAMVQVKTDGSGVEVEDRYTLNFFDSLAVEEALRIKEQVGSGTVTVITLGTQKSLEALRTGIAMGADEAILLEDSVFVGGDEYATAKALAAAVKEMEWDVIICGKEAFDDSSGIVGPLVAEFLGIPHITTVVKVDLSPEDRTVIVEREIEGGKEVIKAPLPVLLTAQKGLNEPRYAALKGIMAAKRIPVDKVEVGSLGIEEGADPCYQVEKFELPPEKAAGTIIQGEDDAAAAAAELVKLLRDEAKAI